MGGAKTTTCTRQGRQRAINNEVASPIASCRPGSKKNITAGERVGTPEANVASVLRGCVDDGFM